MLLKSIRDSFIYVSEQTPGDLSRIFWCPTGPFAFLPIHAAGLYGTGDPQPGNKVSDFVVSSYVPTLSILAPSPKPDAASNGDPAYLQSVNHFQTANPRFPGVDTELQHIRAVIENSPSARTTLLLRNH
ncbi:hypothetical protein J3R82DRAFT_6503 [Butyriboletus roseoflavus]|nr:hypothetical protein J3R82DRAFT_6503 [Butyriboletus roseoflavus]